MKILFQLILVLAVATRQARRNRLREFVFADFTPVSPRFRESQREIAKRRRYTMRATEIKQTHARGVSDGCDTEYGGPLRSDQKYRGGHGWCEKLCKLAHLCCVDFFSRLGGLGSIDEILPALGMLPFPRQILSTLISVLATMHLIVRSVTKSQRPC